MKVFKSFRLLTKTTLFYLIFVMITFFVSAHYIIHKANSYVTEETENIFEHRAKRINWFLQEHDTLVNFRSDEVVLLTDLRDTLNYPQYSDTLIFFSDLEEYQLHRQKIIVVKNNQKAYLVKMLININDFTKLKRDIAHRIIPSFIILALIIILFSTFMSGYLFTPFHRILEQINKYKIGKGSQIHDVKTSTSEFKKMQYLFKRMVTRIEDDYCKLKEYTENMAHEIQTPLAIIRNKTERLIGDENVMKEHQETVKAIYNETNHLSKLGNTLNLLTKIENGEYDKSIHLKTKEIILQHIESVKELVGLKSLSLETDLDNEHNFLIDPFLFEIILRNLLRNSIRYAVNNGPIKISTQNQQLVVSNYGEPLKVDKDKIFERFYTSDKTNQSLGLGLALVKRICELNQLQIDYNYNEGQHIFSIKPMV